MDLRGIKSYTLLACKYFVIQVATSPCTAVKPEVDYQGAALQHLLHKVKKTKTQKQSGIYMLNDSSVSFCSITNCVPKPRNRVAYISLMTVQLVSVTLQIVWRMTQICDVCA